MSRTDASLNCSLSYVHFLHAWGGVHTSSNNFKRVWGVHVTQRVFTMCLCVQGPEVGTLVFLDLFPPYVSILISHLNPELVNRLVWLLRTPVSHPHELALQDSCHTHLGVTWVLGI